jgi:muramoyltetrapeptide carboxypeptidase
MKRKKFLAGILPGALALTSPYALQAAALPILPKIPAYLRKGDRIGITSPAGYVMLSEIEPAIQKLTAWGFEVVVGESIGKRDGTFGGTDEERLADLQQQLNDSSIKAILCARGGYGVVRIIDRLQWSKFVAQPKWLIGFSDITVLHAHINSVLNIATLHAKMATGFPASWDAAEPIQKETIESIIKCIGGERNNYRAPANENNQYGTAEGVLVGGNLKIIETLAGTNSSLATAGKILFVEDVGEQLYNIDRMFWNLLRCGKLKLLKGLIVGGFRIKATDDPAEEFGKTLQEIVLEKVKGLGYPVCFDFPVGHQKNNFALKCGVKHRLLVNQMGSQLQELP